jgi:hypothetical protein
LKWKPRHKFEESLEETVDWYLQNQPDGNRCWSAQRGIEAVEAGVRTGNFRRPAAETAAATGAQTTIGL